MWRGERDAASVIVKRLWSHTVSGSLRVCVSPCWTEFTVGCRGCCLTIIDIILWRVVCHAERRQGLRGWVRRMVPVRMDLLSRRRKTVPCIDDPGARKPSKRRGVLRLTERLHVRNRRLTLHRAVHVGVVGQGVRARVHVRVRVRLDHAHSPSREAVVLKLGHLGMMRVLLHLAHRRGLRLHLALALAFLLFSLFLVLPPLLAQLLEFCTVIRRYQGKTADNLSACGAVGTRKRSTCHWGCA